MARSRHDSVSSTSSLEGRPNSSRSRRHASRTLVACEACKKRKTKCSGRPAKCDACQKLETFCYFNSKLDARRKTAYKPVALHEKKDHIFNGILRALKFNDREDILHLLDVIRSTASPQEIAVCLKQNLQKLQDKNLVPQLEIDENDIVSLALQQLFSHRGKRTTFISRDSAAFVTDNNESGVGHHQDSNVRALRSKGENDDSQLEYDNQHHMMSPEDVDIVSPVNTEPSTSLCLDDDRTTIGSASMGSQSTVSESRRTVIPQKSGRNTTETKAPGMNHQSMPYQIEGERRQISNVVQSSPTYYGFHSHPMGQPYPQGGEQHDQLLSNGQFYMQFNQSLCTSPTEHQSVEQIHHFKRMHNEPFDPANMRLIWPPPQWNREYGTNQNQYHPSSMLG